MNTTKRYLREINYRKAKCCYNCAFCVPNIEFGNYCTLHDNPVGLGDVCKDFKNMEEVKVDGEPDSHL